jgi:hypothetical protein
MPVRRRKWRNRAAGVGSSSSHTPSGPAAARADTDRSGPSPNCAPSPQVSVHAAHPSLESTHGTGA